MEDHIFCWKWLFCHEVSHCPVDLNNLCSIVLLLIYFWRRRLDDWLETKGKSPNRYRHSCCFGQKDEEKDPSNKVSKTRPGGLSSEQLEKQVSKIKDIISEIIALYHVYSDCYSITVIYQIISWVWIFIKKRFLTILRSRS